MISKCRLDFVPPCRPPNHNHNTGSGANHQSFIWKAKAFSDSCLVSGGPEQLLSLNAETERHRISLHLRSMGHQKGSERVFWIL